MTEDIKQIRVVIGSESDFPQIRQGIALLRNAARQGLIKWSLEVCSAHRNPIELERHLERWSNNKVDVIIACAGKFAALFGNIDSSLRNVYSNGHTRVIAVPLKGKTEQASRAALYGVIEVPSHKMIFEKAFFEDPTTAFQWAIENELPIIQISQQKKPKSYTPENAWEASRVHYSGNASNDILIKMVEINAGLYHIGTGKTREIFVTPRHPELLYVLATDRISIFDIVLNALISQKGAVLTAMTVYWLTEIFSAIPNHLVAYGQDVEKYLPSGHLLTTRELRHLMTNMLIVKKAKVLKVEAIMRGNLTGSGLGDYNKHKGVVCGIQLPAGLIDGSELPEIIFTPSTKAPYGMHDENIPFAEAANIIGMQNAIHVKELVMHLYSTARNVALKKGIIIADTKFELGIINDKLTLIDEVLTPDSSRFWPVDGVAKAMQQGVTPPSFDKQPIRDAGEAAGVKDNPSWVPPKELCQQTTARYLEASKSLFGTNLTSFQHRVMGI